MPRPYGSKWLTPRIYIISPIGLALAWSLQDCDMPSEAVHILSCCPPPPAFIHACKSPADCTSPSRAAALRALGVPQPTMVLFLPRMRTACTSGRVSNKRCLLMVKCTCAFIATLAAWPLYLLDVIWEYQKPEYACTGEARLQAVLHQACFHTGMVMPWTQPCHCS